MSFPLTTDELVDNLFAVIQNIVAGTAFHSVKMLNKTCLQWKIKLSSNTPIIIFHYEQKCDENERFEIVPVTDFRIMHENSGTEDDVNFTKQVNSITFHERRENSLALYNIKQEIPELLLLLNNYNENNDKSKEGNKSKSSSIIVNSGTESISSTMNNLCENVTSSSIMKLIPVTVSESKMKVLQTEEENGNCDDQSKRSEKKGNDNGIRMKGRPVKKKSIKPYECKICGKRFAFPSKLLLHMRIHTGEKPFKCDICAKSFNSSNNLTSHMRIHTDEKPFKCEICDKSFTSSGYLIIHKRIHRGEKPFKCEICTKSFTTKGSLIIHERIHTGEKPFKCEICNKSFTSSGDLVIHKRMHTGEKPFKGNVCERSFTQGAHLKQHERIHTGEKPFKCNACNKSYTQRAHLNKHERIHAVKRVKDNSSTASIKRKLREAQLCDRK